MSALYLLVLFASWILVTWLIYRIWNLALFRPLDGSRGPVHTAIGVLTFAGWFGWSFWEVGGKNLYWDYKVRQLCAADGGLIVHHQVALPKSEFDEFGNIGVPPKRAAKLDDEFYFVTHREYLRDDSPKISRSITQIVRRSNGEILGISTRYDRSGGNRVLPGHPSAYHCPGIRIAPGGLESAIFIMKEHNNE